MAEVVGGPRAPEQTLTEALHGVHPRVSRPSVEREAEKSMARVRADRSKRRAPSFEGRRRLPGLCLPGQTKRTACKTRLRGWPTSGRREASWLFCNPSRASRPSRFRYPSKVQTSREARMPSDPKPQMRRVARPEQQNYGMYSGDNCATCMARREVADCWGPKAHGPLRGPDRRDGRGAREGLRKRPAFLKVPPGRPPPPFAIQHGPYAPCCQTSVPRRFSFRPGFGRDRATLGRIRPTFGGRRQ